MEIKKGIGVSPGVVIGTAIVLDAEDIVVPKRQVDASQVPEEAKRLDKALAASAEDLADLVKETKAKHGAEIGKIFDFHIGILRDKTLHKQITKEITTSRWTA